ncbi:MAG: hypothetical protein ABSD20_15495 [Terriglobales bacterium]
MGKGSVNNQRIDSWKEIAAFFGRDERTVKRWEKERALPVHRVPGSERGGVFAYRGELTRWLNSNLKDETKDKANPRPAHIGELVEFPTLDEEGAPILPFSNAGASVPVTKGPFWKPVRGAWLLAIAAILIGTTFAIRYAGRLFRGNMPSTETNQGRVRHAPNPEAQEFYLQGRYYWNRRTGDSLKQAVDAFIQAIVHDSDYAEAYAGLAATYDLMPEYTPMPASVAYPRAIAAATKAVALDDSLPEAHRALAFGLFYWNWEVPRALAEFRKAIQLDPNDIEAHHWYSTSLSILGRFDESLVEIDKARRLSPASRSILADRALIVASAGDRKSGIDALREIELAEPDFLSPPRYLASLLLQKKDYPGFIAQTRRAALISNDVQEAAMAEAAERGWQKGGEGGMLEEIARTQQKFFEDGKSTGFSLAYTCALQHRKKDAVRYLRAAFAARDLYLLTIVRDPIDGNLRGDPDFEQLKRQMQAYIDGSVKDTPDPGVQAGRK